MQLSTFLFLIFLTAISIVFYLLPPKTRWVWLLIASYLFCPFSDWRFGIILLSDTIISYFIGILIFKTDERKKKKTFLLIGILLTLSFLFSFKYLNFCINIFEDILRVVGVQKEFPAFNWLLPLGLSFYTFQIISYLLDIYNGVIQVEKNFCKYALYLVFFPKLISGPIERADHLIVQFSNPKPFEYQRFIAALLRIFWGFFKKLVIANRLEVLVGTVFNNPTDFYAPQTIVAVISFSLQIYIDFSAYCDIAIGAASIFGIDLVENFNLPYLAQSVTEFWRRWHISLTNWLRDYIFIPLNFASRRKNTKIWLPINIVIVFLVSGIWHGANYTFIIWGLLHGLYQAIETITLKWRKRLEKRFVHGFSGFIRKTVEIFITFGLVCFAWIFFRADNIHVAVIMIKRIITLLGSLHAIAWDMSILGLSPADFVILITAIAIFVLFEIFNQKHDLFYKSQSWPLPVRWLVYLIIIFVVILFGYFGTFTASDFIYAGF